MARICGNVKIPLNPKDLDDFPVPGQELNKPPKKELSRFPWAVSITLKRKNDLKGKNKLGGALISPYHVLTAAHGFLLFSTYVTKCSAIKAARYDEMDVLSATGYRDFIEIQQRDVNYGGVCIRGTERFLPNHKQCEHADVTRNKIRAVLVDHDFASGSCVKGHDWAIIELEERVQFSERVRPICLPHVGMVPQRLLSIPGWGRTYVFYEAHPLLHETIMLYSPECPRPYTDLMPAHAPDMLCAVSLNTTDFWAPRTCLGDSGAGMQQIDADGRVKLIALTSFGTSGCPSNELGRFTKVETYLGAICEETGVCYSAVTVHSQLRKN